MDKKSELTFFFDFDGVLVDSTNIKTDAFRKLFKPYGHEAVNKIVEYHQRHGGISRVDKIDYAHRHILDRPYSKSTVSGEAEMYSKLVFEAVVNTNWIPGAQEFVEAYSQQALIFVISGTPEAELHEVIKRRNMSHYFEETLGSPTKKPEHIRFLVQKYNLKIQDCVFIGDALTDYDAAKETGMNFIGIQSEATFPPNTLVLPDCTGLTSAMARFGGDKTFPAT